MCGHWITNGQTGQILHLLRFLFIVWKTFIIKINKKCTNVSLGWGCGLGYCIYSYSLCLCDVKITIILCTKIFVFLKHPSSSVCLPLPLTYWSCAALMLAGQTVIIIIITTIIITTFQSRASPVSLTHPSLLLAQRASGNLDIPTRAFSCTVKSRLSGSFLVKQGKGKHQSGYCGERRMHKRRTRRR